MQIFPSLVSQDIHEIKQHIRLLSRYCAGFHIDIMDGIFVQQIMGNAELTNDIAHLTEKQLWIHLMVERPLAVIKNLKLRNGDKVTFHSTAKYEYSELIQEFLNKGLQPSMALNPETAIHAINNVICSINHTTIMSVQPGKSGQIFLHSTIDKLDRKSV